MSSLKPIETVYKGYRFRSRLEARWAVFFDALGLEWEYEKEGFELEGGLRYLPDFWLPKHGWIEIKPSYELSGNDQDKLCGFKLLVDKMNKESSAAWWKEHDALDPGANGAPWISFCILAGNPYYDGEQHSYKVLRVINGKVQSLDEHWVECPGCRELDCSSAGTPYEGTESVYCSNCDFGRGFTQTNEVWFHKGDVQTTRLGIIYGSPRLMHAYQAARSARFEFGENGCPKSPN